VKAKVIANTGFFTPNDVQLPINAGKFVCVKKAKIKTEKSKTVIRT